MLKSNSHWVLRLNIDFVCELNSNIVFPVPQYSDATMFKSLTDHTEGTDHHGLGMLILMNPLSLPFHIGKKIELCKCFSYSHLSLLLRGFTIMSGICRATWFSVSVLVYIGIFSPLFISSNVILSRSMRAFSGRGKSVRMMNFSCEAATLLSLRIRL